VAADTVGFLDNGVHAQLGDLVDERVLVDFPVLHHWGQQREDASDYVLDEYFTVQKTTEGIFF